MKRFSLLVMLCLFVFGTAEIHSQNLKRFVSKKNGSSEKSDSTAVKRGINKGIDRLQVKWLGNEEETSTGGSQYPGDQGVSNSSESNPSSTSGGNSSGAFGSAFGNSMMSAMGLSGNANVEEQYEFDTYLKMEIVNYEKNGSMENAIYDTYTSNESMSYAMIYYDNRGVGTIIFDTENNLMLTLSDSDEGKTGFAVAFDSDSLEEDIKASAEEYQEDLEDNPYNQYKTGKTKTILGYKCEEYLIEDEDTETHAWITKDLNKVLRKEMMNNTGFSSIFLYTGYNEGMTLEYDFIDKKKKEKVTMTVKELDFDKKHTISTRGYSIFSMGTTAPEE